MRYNLLTELISTVYAWKRRIRGIGKKESRNMVRSTVRDTISSHGRISMNIDDQWERAEKYARNFAFRHFKIPDTRRVENLRNNIFEYIRKRDLNLDYSESAIETKQYCFTCLAWLPKFHFC